MKINVDEKDVEMLKKIKKDYILSIGFDKRLTRMIDEVEK